MKYVIAYLVKGEAEKYHQSLVKEVAKRFNVTYTKRNFAPSHITLKGGFNTSPKRIKEMKVEIYLNSEEEVKKIDEPWWAIFAS